MPDSVFLRIAAINYDETVFDTEDLSTIRGSSLALLQIPERLIEWMKSGEEYPGLEVRYLGASEGVVRIPGRKDALEIENAIQSALKSGDFIQEESLKGVLPFLIFSIAAVTAVDGVPFSTVMSQLQTRETQLRYRQLTVVLPEMTPESTKPCAFDKVRPAVEKLTKGDKKTGDYEEFDVSRSVYVRHKYGVSARSDFYMKKMDENLKNVVLPVDITMMLRANEELDLPVSACNKMAVLFMDGNSFRKKRSRALDDENGAGVFSKYVEQGQKLIFQKLIPFCLEHGSVVSDGKGGGTKKRLLPFETLLSGGDDLLFVFPSWLAFDAMAIIGTALESQWEDYSKQPDKILNEPLTYAGGLVICHYKTPIREAKRLAQTLAGEAKEAIGRELSAFRYMILESLEPPVESQSEIRQARFNIESDPSRGMLRNETLQLSGKLTNMLVTIRRWKKREEGTGLPSRSWARKILMKSMSNPSRLRDSNIDMLENESYNDFINNLQNMAGISIEKFLQTLEDVPTIGDLKMPFFSLYHLLEIWDYVGLQTVEEVGR